MIDRELDALVAQHVFGVDETTWRRAGSDSYSTDIFRAWQVVARLTGQGLGYSRMFTLTCDPSESAPDGTWTACFSSLVSRDAIGRADDAPRAICLAALSAVGVETFTP